jgi:hypothetical protein
MQKKPKAEPRTAGGSGAAADSGRPSHGRRFRSIDPMMSEMAMFENLSSRMQLVCQEAKGECCRRENQNECGWPNAFDIPYTQM